ncbi:MAG: hypothetical protein JWM93_2454 [Frankiales bacterium]|nr:hypothetical protein [Frankiales bacterium]
MSDLVPTEDIERIVGAKRHPTEHVARAVSAEEQVYLLHSAECLALGRDLRDCPYSLALDEGINDIEWEVDAPLVVAIAVDDGYARLIPKAAAPVSDSPTENGETT